MVDMTSPATIAPADTDVALVVIAGARRGRDALNGAETAPRRAGLRSVAVHPVRQPDGRSVRKVHHRGSSTRSPTTATAAPPAPTRAR